MITHLGKKITGKRLENARLHASKVEDRYAKSILEGKIEFASHVTRLAQIEIANKESKYAEEIREGRHDSNFTIWQRMDTFLTGECIALLA